MKRRGRPRIPGIRRRLRCVSSAIRRRWCCWMGVRRVLRAAIQNAGSGFARTSYAAFRGAPSILAHLMCAPGSRRLQSLAYEPLAVPLSSVLSGRRCHKGRGASVKCARSRIASRSQALKRTWSFLAGFVIFGNLPYSTAF